jgi:hypothetical protein
VRNYYCFLLSNLFIVVLFFTASFGSYQLNAMEAENEDRCLICYDFYDEEKIIKTTLLCGHSFCMNCLKNTCAEYAKCPFCREYISLDQFEMILDKYKCSLTPEECDRIAAQYEAFEPLNMSLDARIRLFKERCAALDAELYSFLVKSVLRGVFVATVFSDTIPPLTSFGITVSLAGVYRITLRMLGDCGKTLRMLRELSQLLHDHMHQRRAI